MTLRSYFILMMIATAACYLALLAVIYFFDPNAGGVLALSLFYTSLSLALVGTFSILGLIVRLIFTNDKLVFKKVTTSFRQAVWFSILIGVSLYLNKINLLDWKYLILLIFAMALLELFFMSYKVKSKQNI